MAISYTDNFRFPLLDVGSDGWDAVMNGMLIDVDKLLAEARNPLIWDDKGQLAWDTDSTGILTYDGEILLYA